MLRTLCRRDREVGALPHLQHGGPHQDAGSGGNVAPAAADSAWPGWPFRACASRAIRRAEVANLGAPIAPSGRDMAARERWIGEAQLASDRSADRRGPLLERQAPPDVRPLHHREMGRAGPAGAQQRHPIAGRGLLCTGHAVIVHGRAIAADRSCGDHCGVRRPQPDRHWRRRSTPPRLLSAQSTARATTGEMRAARRAGAVAASTPATTETTSRAPIAPHGITGENSCGSISRSR